MRVVFVAALFGWLGATAILMGFLVARYHWERRVQRMKAARAIRPANTPLSDEAHEKILKAVEVAEPLSQEEMDELDDFMLFEDLAEDPAWVQAGIEWASCHATWRQKP